LLEAMIGVAAERGYADTSVARVIASAGTSRSTFYEHFRDKDECFLAASSLLGDRLLAGNESGAKAAPSLADGLLAVVRFVHVDPLGAKVLFVESLAAGEFAMELRESVLHQLAQAATPGGSTELASALFGGIFRLLAVRLRDGGEGLAAEETSGLLRWLGSYGSLRADQPPAPAGAAALGRPAPLAPSPLVGLDRSGSRRSGRATAQERRLWVMSATATCAYRTSYSQMTVADIVVASAISRRGFYELFGGKAAAATAADHGYFQMAMTVTAGEFFAARSWPERVWAAGGALLDFVATRPAESYLAFVETHAIGQTAVQLTYDRLAAFTLFLEEGYAFRPESRDLPRVCSEALMSTIFELAFRELRELRDAEQLFERLPQLAFLVLAPFMGARAASTFISEKTAAAQPPDRDAGDAKMVSTFSLESRSRGVAHPS
jgi:AcrR family transcriptional regulator